MTKINIDELCEPIEVTVGEKDYTITDISPEVAAKMAKLSNVAKEAEDAGKEADPTDTEAMTGLMAEIMGADKVVLAKLGMRKRLMLVTQVMKTINEEIEGKNVPKAVVAK